MSSLPVTDFTFIFIVEKVEYLLSWFAHSTQNFVSKKILLMKLIGYSYWYYLERNQHLINTLLLQFVNKNVCNKKWLCSKISWLKIKHNLLISWEIFRPYANIQALIFAHKCVAFLSHKCEWLEKFESIWLTFKTDGLAAMSTLTWITGRDNKIKTFPLPGAPTAISSRKKLQSVSCLPHVNNSQRWKRDLAK